MQLPREVIVGEGVIERVGEVCSRLGFTGTALIVSGPVTDPLVGERVAKSTARAGFAVDHAIVKEASPSVLADVLEKIRKSKAKLVLAVGGGKDIDLAKLASAKASVNFISVPTAASHDGISSPYASIKGAEKPYSVRGEAPVAILPDMDALLESPSKCLAAGCRHIVASGAPLE